TEISQITNQLGTQSGADNRLQQQSWSTRDRFELRHRTRIRPGKRIASVKSQSLLQSGRCVEAETKLVVRSGRVFCVPDQYHPVDDLGGGALFWSLVGSHSATFIFHRCPDLQRRVCVIDGRRHRPVAKVQPWRALDVHSRNQRRKSRFDAAYLE